MSVPFVFDGVYKNVEQVRPYFPEYQAIRRELEAAGRLSTDNRYRRRVPSLVSATTDDEGTAIYLLQQMYELDAIRDQVAAFETAGGRHIAVADLSDSDVLHGTVASYGWGLGGTGWEQNDNVHLLRRRQALAVRGKDGRARTTSLAGRKVMFRPTPKR